MRAVAVACDGGMGSSVLVAGQLGSALAPFGVTVRAVAINDLPVQADVVVCQEALLGRVRAAVPGTVVLGFRLFLGDPVLDRLAVAVREGADLVG